jgi:hypothetical protein
MEDMSKHIKVGEILIPIDYWSMDEDDRTKLCLTLMDGMLTILDKTLNPEFDRLAVLDMLLESSILSNQENEEYEVCEVMSSIRKLIND